MTLGARTDMVNGTASLEDDQRLVALACRILAHRGLVEDVLGHVSLRRPDGRVLVRSRGTSESGLLFTEPTDVRLLEADGTTDSTHYRVPNELHIHTEILRRRPDVRAVVHAHPPAVVAADLAGLELQPIVGAYNIPASRMARDGIPTFGRSVLINTPQLGEDLADTMGTHPACVMRGHGIVTVGATVQEAVCRALAVDSLARMTLRASVNGQTPRIMPEEDINMLPDLGTTFNYTQLWRFNEASLSAAGLGLA